MKKIILDTDLGGDCDDVGAVAVLCNLAKKGEAEICAVTYCIGNPWGSYFVKNELVYFGYPAVPVGSLKDAAFMTEDNYARYTRPFTEAHHLPTPETEDAVRVLRRTLAENGGKKDITLVAIGPLRNIANLLRSEADDISPESGIGLVEKNVAKFVTMLGSFDRPDYAEWNVLMDIPSAQYVIDTIPAPIVYSPHEAGSDILTGVILDTVPESHPVRGAYTIYCGEKHMRSSWDLITVYYAVRGCENLWKEVKTQASVDTRGCIAGEGKPAVYIVQTAKNEEVAAAIEPLMI